MDAIMKLIRKKQTALYARHAMLTERLEYGELLEDSEYEELVFCERCNEVLLGILYEIEQMKAREGKTKTTKTMKAK